MGRSIPLDMGRKVFCSIPPLNLLLSFTPQQSVKTALQTIRFALPLPAGIQLRATHTHCLDYIYMLLAAAWIPSGFNHFHSGIFRSHRIHGIVHTT